MKDSVSCPFCGVSFEPFTEKASARHPVLDALCPVSGFVLTIDGWNKRPPRKEQLDMPVVESEVEWLRSIVRDVIAMKVVNITLPNGMKVSEGNRETNHHSRYSRT